MFIDALPRLPHNRFQKATAITPGLVRSPTMTHTNSNITVPVVAFFDSHGALWVTCSPETEGAQAFGPTGCAVRSTLFASPRKGETEWSFWNRMGSVIRADDEFGFDVLGRPSKY